MTSLPGALLGYVILPAWIAAGFADWACHRRTRIEANGGVPESNCHVLLTALGGAGIVAATVLEVTSAVLVLLAALWLVHEFVTWLELRYAVPRRPVRPFEQMVHAALEMMPLTALLLVAVLHPQAALAPFTAGDADWALRLAPALPPWPLVGTLAAAVLLFDVIPLAEEQWRCRRAAPRSLSSRAAFATPDLDVRT